MERLDKVLAGTGRWSRREVKRMLAARGAPVLYLKRLSMGPLVLDEALPVGAFRELTAAETATLRAAAGL